MSEPLAKVYVVDDDPSVRKSLARLLRSAGYQTETFSTAGASFSITVVCTTLPAASVLDVEMPGCKRARVAVRAPRVHRTPSRSSSSPAMATSP